MPAPKSLVPPTPDRTLKGRIARSKDLLARLVETEDRHRSEGNFGAADLFAEMADEQAARIAEMQHEGRNA